jgi:hypothetical protein
LGALPAGWSSAGGSFGCSGLGSGGGCQLSLMYAPTAAGSGTLSLSYTYLNDAGEPKSGSLSLPYAATTNDNIVETPSQNPVAVFTGASAAVGIVFTTDDGNLASALSVTSNLAALPSGWSSTSSSFTCATVSTGSACTLGLLYAPTAAASGTLSLTYGYNDDAGAAKTGSVSILYSATPPPHLYVAQLSGAFSYCTLNADGTLGSCAATGNGFTAPAGIAFSGSNAYVADYTANAVFLCAVGADGSLSGCAATGSGFQQPWQLAINGSTLYATNLSSSGGVTTCTIALDGTLSGCTQSSGGSGTSGIATGASYAYVGTGPATVDACAISVSGLSGCTAAGGTFSNADGISLANGYAYIANQGNGTVSVCSVDANGLFSACTASSVGSQPMDVVFSGNYAYVDDAGGNIYLCSVGTGGALSGCIVSDGGSTFPLSAQIAIH